MKVSDTKLPGVMQVERDCFEDHRGYYTEIYNKQDYAEQGLDIDFVEEDISVSYQNVLRGLHGDPNTWKLVSCLHGRFYLVVLNYDRDSVHFGQWQSFMLSDQNHRQILIPPNHANGHLVLSDKAIFHYKQSQYYDPSQQFTVKWNDEEFNIWWPIKEPMVSIRDEVGHYV